MRAIIANLGFVLQTSGVLTLLAVIPGFIYNEQTALISFFITASVFLVAGFAINSLSQRRDLDFKASCVLISIVFVILSIVGAIPYLYCNVFGAYGVGSRIANSLFESASGFTTTGFSMIVVPEALPKSLIFYRALTQWIGGIGVVFVVLVFFNSNGALDKLGKAIGFTRITSNIHNSYIRILGIYAIYTAIFFGLLYIFGLRNWINNISLVFSGISTGGFSPVADLAPLIAFPKNLILAILMLLGATSFVVHFRLFSGKFRKAINQELVVFILVVLAFSVFLTLMKGMDFMTAFFHVSSASSTTGFSSIDLTGLTANAKTLLLILMFVGGMASSTAGGVKISGVLVFLKSIPWVIQGVASGKLEKFEMRGKEYRLVDVLVPLVVIIMTVVIIVGFSLAFTSQGFSMVDSIFVLTSALSNTGLYAGVANEALPIILKFVLIVLMIGGRIGLIALLVALIPRLAGRQPAQASAVESKKTASLEGQS